MLAKESCYVFTLKSYLGILQSIIWDCLVECVSTLGGKQTSKTLW
jgi:hypothetical protein